MLKSLLEVKGLNFKLGDRQMFDGVDLLLKAGEHVAVVGESGCGKSTLLTLIAEGWKGVESSVGDPVMVLQEGALLDHLSVIENLNLVDRYVENTSVSSTKLLAQLDIDNAFFDRPVSTLSGGQMRRVAIARALVTDTKLMLFDEPDAGLDIANLSRLAQTVCQLNQHSDRACMTVSHNPFYIAQVATKVVKLVDGKLETLFDWEQPAKDQADIESRQLELQTELAKFSKSNSAFGSSKKSREWALPLLCRGLGTVAKALLSKVSSLRDELKIAGYSLYLNLITGLVFFFLVGLMLGSTTVAVVRTLADSALTGVVSWFVDPEDLVAMMRGRFALYLAPAVGGMLYIARSGSIVSNWLGEMVRGRQVRALTYLGISPYQYLVRPNLIAVYIGMLSALMVFCAAIWLGGVIATQQLFAVDNAVSVMSLTESDIRASNFWPKALLYSGLVSVILNAFAFSPKRTAHQVNIHTTKCIIYATLSIALAEMLMILI